VRNDIVAATRASTVTTGIIANEPDDLIWIGTELLVSRGSSIIPIPVARQQAAPA
jgi:hypothetical protein